MSTISEQEFKKLCDDVYADRARIYRFNPNVSRREALLWMLLGCLLSLLSVPVLEQPGVYGDSGADPYGDAVCALLRERMMPAFDPRIYLNELSRKIEADETDAL
jgi:hypothetical protein